MTNGYANPEKLDLEKIAELDNGDSWNWDIKVIYKHTPTGNFYYYSDGGCSCNYPRFYSISELEQIESPEAFAQSFMKEEYSHFSYTDRVKFVWEATDAMRGRK